MQAHLAKSFHQNRFPCSTLSGDDIQPRSEDDMLLFYQGKVPAVALSFACKWRHMPMQLASFSFVGLAHTV